MSTADSKHREPRRRGYALAVATAAFAFAAVATLAVIGASETTQRVPAAADRPAAFDDAPDDDDAPATVVTAWSRVEVGWMYAYGDGRVVLRPDSGRLITPEGDVYYGIIQRHLGPVGAKLLRSGALDPADVVASREGRVTGLWSPSGQSLYRPSAYALCLLNTAPNPPPTELLLDVPDIIDTLTPSVRALLRDSAVRSFTDDFLDENGEFVGMDGFHSAPGSGVDCLVIDVERMLALWAQTRIPLGGPDDRGVLRISDATFGMLSGTDGTDFLVASIPILPHGGWVLWAN